MPLLDGLRVIRSNIHGYGVITLRKFYRGDIVLYGDGVLWREEDEFDDTYCLLLPPYIPNEDGSEGTSLYFDLTCQSRWINHSCDPNTEVDTSWLEQEGKPKAWWVALRDIEVGEELTYDYAFSGHLAEPCYCGAKTCRGVICDQDELDLVPKKFRSRIPEHLLKAIG